MRQKLLQRASIFIVGISSFFSCFAFGAEPIAEKPNRVPNKVRVEFYVMSKCPFGTRVENSIAPVLKKLNEYVEFSLDFIGESKDGKLSSMHGPYEVQGDKVQLCAAKYSPAKYMDMIVCMNKNERSIPTNWESCAEEAGIDIAKVKACYEGPEAENLLKASFEEAQKRRARGSPTMFIGDSPYLGPRSETAFTRAICNAIQGNKPQLCLDFPPPAAVPISIITDKRCKDCNAQLWAQRLKTLFLGSKIKIYYYSDPEGKALFESQGVKLLPAILFGKEVTKSENYDRLQRFLQPRDGMFALMIGAKFDPSKEICDNGKDDTGNGLVDCKDADCKNTLICRKEVPKKLEVFVMSQCPYGVKALDAMKEVLDNFDNEIEFQVHYIASAMPDGNFRSLHGQGEVDEDIRELCAMKHYPKGYKWMDYVLCRNKNIRSDSWELCTGSNGISKDVISKCFKNEGTKLLEEDIRIAEGLGIGASPTWLANNKFKFSGIDAETVRKNLCQYNKGMANCNRQLGGPLLPEADCKDR